MKQQGGLKLLFDENFGGKIVRDFAAFCTKWSTDVEAIEHLIDIVPPGTSDKVWLKTIAEGNWVVVSADLGRGKRNQRLPEICSKLGITHVLIRGKLHHRPMFEKLRAVLVSWPSLLQARDQPKGTRFRLRAGHSSDANPVIERC